MTPTLTELLTSDLAAKESSSGFYPGYLQERAGHMDRLPRSRPGTSLWAGFKLPVPEEDMSYRSIQIVIPEMTDLFVPRTALGHKLLLLRIRAIQAGMRLLSANEVLEEVRRRRGELERNETDLY